MDVLLVNRVLDDFPGAKRSIARGVKISGFVVEGALQLSPSFNFRDLD